MIVEPLFSVLIANYNNGRFLQEAIDSVFAQSYTNWEIVIVDDKSTDNSFEIYEKYKANSRFHIFYNEKNEGCGFTKRRCAEMANGEICGFLDPDDALAKDAIEIMIKEHELHEDVSMVYSRYYYADEQLNILGVSEHQCVLPDGVSFMEYGDGAISHFVSYKKSYYDQTVGIDEGYKRAVDHALYFLLEEVGKTHFIDKPLYYYRSNTGLNISTNGNSDYAFYWDVIVMADACKRRGMSVEEIAFRKMDAFINEIKEVNYQKGADAVRLSRTYTVGKRVLKPFKWLIK